MRRIKLVLPMILAVCAAGCSQSGYKKTPSGLEYKIFESHGGVKPKEGDYLKVQLIVKAGDSTLHDTHQGVPTHIPFHLSHQRFDVMEGLAMLSPGDSALFVIPGDSLPIFQRPPFLKKGQDIKMYVKLMSIQTFQELQDDIKQQQQQQLSKDDKVISDYLAQNHLQATKTPSGVYIVVHDPGTGNPPKEGQLVSINYTGKSLEGKAFDSNTDSTLQTMHHDLRPLQFMAGRHQMIQGVDDAVMQLKKGAKATVYIPSSLGYGPNGNPPVIQPNENLIFDIEVLDITDAPKTPAPAAPQPQQQGQ